MIDDYLKRYSTALGHLSECTVEKTFEDVLAYVKKHDLYQDGMRLYKDQLEQYNVSVLPPLGLTPGYFELLCGVSGK